MQSLTSAPVDAEQPSLRELVTAGAVTALGVLVVVMSLGMPVQSLTRADVLNSPGLVPGLLGVSLTLLGGQLSVREARRFARAGDLSHLRSEVVAAARRLLEPDSLRVALTMGLVIAYAGLLPLLGYWQATIGLIFVFVTVFAEERTPLRLLAAAVLAVTLATTIEFVFSELLRVPLP